jgi:hypothetical protein
MSGAVCYVPAVADDVDDNIRMKTATPLSSQVAHTDDCLHVVPVHMKNRCTQSLCYVCTVGRGSTELGICCERNL